MAILKLASLVLQKLPVIRPSGPVDLYSRRISKCCAFYAAHRHPTAECEELILILKEKFPLAKNIDVNDISGGCGEMIEVNIESVEFKGLTVVKQHRLVNEALKDQIKQMHGLTINTSVPPESRK